jgi:diphosphomevalonate decarboxylase
MNHHHAGSATAVAQPNIALVKYWGKRDVALNLPAGGSISITLADLTTRTSVTFDPALTADRVLLGGVPALPAASAKVTRTLDLVRAAAGMTSFAQVESTNNFPTGAGLASSASGFAALVVAADAASGAGLSRARLSEFARRGSGSAARSLIGGFAELHRGTRQDGSDAVATPLLAPADWPLTTVIAITCTAPKSVGSGAGMERTRTTSPFYAAWLDMNDAALAEARTAIAGRDFAALADVAEHSSTAMHAVMLSTRPALIYWNGATVDLLHAVRELRETTGVPVFATVDAGPQVKAVCLPEAAETVAERLRGLPGVIDIRVVGLGEGARLSATTDLAVGRIPAP